jgi:hypothetical protein
MNKYFQVSCNNIKSCKNGGKTVIDLKDGPGSDPYRCECPKEYQGDLCDKFGKIYREVVNLTLFKNLCLYLFIYLAFPTRAGSPQQHMPITVGPFCLTHHVNFPSGRKPEYPEETHNFRHSVDFYSFHMRTGFESHGESSH